MDKFFRIVSTVFSPVIVPCYGLAIALCVTGLSVIPFGVRMTVIAMCALMLFIMPALAILALYRAKIISDPGLDTRNERTVPYCITAACYIICAYFLVRIGAPLWLVGIIAGGLLAIVIDLLVNLRWKISGHLTGMGGLVAVVLFIAANHLNVMPMLAIAIAAIFLAGLVATARLALRRHTPLQVVAGTLCGFVSVWTGAFVGLLMQGAFV